MPNLGRSRKCAEPRITPNSFSFAKIANLVGLRQRSIFPSASAKTPDNCDSSNAPSSCVQFPLRQAFVNLVRVKSGGLQERQRNLNLLETVMTSNESKNEMLVMVLTDLAAICMKLAENSVVPEELRFKPDQFLEQFDSLAPYRGKGTGAKHARCEQLWCK